MKFVRKFHVSELWIEMNVYDPRSFFFFESLCYLSSSEKGLKNSGLNGYLNPEPCDAGAVLYQLSYLTSWELVIMWVDD